MYVDSPKIKTTLPCLQCGLIPRTVHRFCSRACKSIYSKARWKALPQQEKRHSNIKRYGISFNEATELLKTQNNQCAICMKLLDLEHPDTHIDHCHTTKRIRGILCHNCNVGIGHFRDDVMLLKNAIEYLQSK